MSNQHFLTRKDIARLLEISVKSVHNNEHRLGLDIARVDVNRRYVRYVRTVALAELRTRGQVVGDL